MNFGGERKENMNLLYRICSRFFPNCVTSKMKVQALRKSGVIIGRGTVLFDAGNITIDCSRPELLSIGEYCKITSGVVILTHDYSRSVLRRVYGEVLGEARETKIGNNVFLGMNTIVLMGGIIHDNCIVGAGSVCHGEYPPNSVIAGNPAEVIMTLDEYYNKRKQKTVEEAKIEAKAYYQRYKVKPTIQSMNAFFPLYLERSEKALKENNIRTNLNGDDEQEVIDYFLNSKPSYPSFEDFLIECDIE